MKKFVLFLLSALVLITGVSSAEAKVKSEISIYPWPDKGAFGFVKSKKPRLCSKNRQVVVWKAIDREAVEIGRTRALKRNGGFTWSLRNKRATSGTVGVVAVRTGDCGRAKAKREQMPQAGEIPQCPSTAAICHLQRMHIEDLIRPFDHPDCSMWLPDSAHYRTLESSCPADIKSGPSPFCCWSVSYMSWTKDTYGDSPRTLTFRYGGTEWQPMTVYISGRLPRADSARYTITKAWLPTWRSDVEWFTPDLPGAEPGTQGGPIYFNIENGSFRGFDIYIGGFLYRR